jgi:hypothetical protein
MNEIFSFKRFRMLLTKELKEKTPMILKIAGIMSLIIFGIWLTNILIAGGTPIGSGTRFVIICVLTTVAMIIAPFDLYKSYNHSKKGIDYALLPASVYEKYASMLVLVVIVLPLTVLLSTILSDTILSIISPSVFNGTAISVDSLSKINLENIYDALVLQWLFIFGNFLFKKNKVTKTIFMFLLLYLVLGLIFASTVKIIYAEEIESMTKLSVNIGSFGNIIGNADLSAYPGLKWMSYTMSFITNFILPVGCLSGTLLKMKNQQY